MQVFRRHSVHEQRGAWLAVCCSRHQYVWSRLHGRRNIPCTGTKSWLKVKGVNFFHNFSAPAAWVPVGHRLYQVDMDCMDLHFWQLLLLALLWTLRTKFCISGTFTWQHVQKLPRWRGGSEAYDNIRMYVFVHRKFVARWSTVDTSLWPAGCSAPQPPIGLPTRWGGGSVFFSLAVSRWHGENVNLFYDVCKSSRVIDFSKQHWNRWIEPLYFSRCVCVCPAWREFETPIQHFPNRNPVLRCPQKWCPASGTTSVLLGIQAIKRKDSSAAERCGKIPRVWHESWSCEVERAPPHAATSTSRMPCRNTHNWHNLARAGLSPPA